MTKYEDGCVNCPRELGCIGANCPRYEVQSIYCEFCGEPAEYKIEGDDYCEDCAKKYLQDVFGNLSVREMANILGEDVTRIT